MNIRARIRKLEKATGAGSRFCLCYGENLKYEVIPITIDEWKRRFDAGEERHERLPDFCDQCGKPIDKSRIETTFEQFIETIQARQRQAAETMAMFAD